MWRHLPVDVVAEQAREVAGGRYPFLLPDEDMDVSYFLVDGQAMAEGGVEDRLRAMAPALGLHGVELQAELVDLPRADEGDYVVAINGRRCRVWGPEDWPGYRAWETATVRPLAVVNDLLAEADAVARLFVLNAGGNEGVAWLLDPRIVAAVDRSGLVVAGEVPCLAVDNT